MSIDKQKLQKLLWAEAASFRADCAGWKLNTERLQDFLGDKTVEEVALELLAENEALRNVLQEATDELRALKASVGFRGHTLDVLHRIDAAMGKAVQP
ncbi:hypothetical protein [Pseudomonas sp. S2_C03]